MSQLIRETLANMIARELEFDGALVTLTEVEVTHDLSNAKVKVSVIPHTAEKRVFTVLKKFEGRLQNELNKKLNLKPMPYIIFVIDEGLERAARIEKDLLEVEKEEGK